MAQLKNTVECTMFYGAKPIIFERAKEMRKSPTKAEKSLWEILRKNQIMGLRFKQQHPINIFIADFYCHAIKLVVEVDGKIHNKEENKDNDLNRTAELESYGITVIRFSNDEVLEDIEEVRNKIELECKRLLKA